MGDHVKQKVPKGFRETTVYAYRRDSTTKKRKIDRVRGLEETKPFRFKYYWHKGSRRWFAVDNMTGLSVASGDTLKEVYDMAHDEDRLAAFDCISKTKEYAANVVEHYKAMVECGAYVELHQTSDR